MAKKLLNQKKYFSFATLFKQIKVGHVHFLYSFFFWHLYNTYTYSNISSQDDFSSSCEVSHFEKKNGKSGSPSELSKC